MSTELLELNRSEVARIPSADSVMQKVERYEFMVPERRKEARELVCGIVEAGRAGFGKQVEIRAKRLLHLVDEDRTDRVIAFGRFRMWDPEPKRFAVFPDYLAGRDGAGSALIIESRDVRWAAVPVSMYDQEIPHKAISRVLALRREGLGLCDLRVAVPHQHPRFRSLLAAHLKSAAEATVKIAAMASTVPVAMAMGGMLMALDPVLLGRIRKGSPTLIEVARWD